MTPLSVAGVAALRKAAGYPIHQIAGAEIIALCDTIDDLRDVIERKEREIMVLVEDKATLKAELKAKGGRRR